MVESKEYSVMYREGEFGWIMTQAKLVTNSAALRGSVNMTEDRRKVLDEELGQ